MPSAHVIVETNIENSVRTKQLSAMFDVPLADVSRLEWNAELPIEDEPWNVGLIVGPSGAGKTQIASRIFDKHFHPKLRWQRRPVIDDFKKALSIQDISKACQAVGFNTIPAWMRPYAVLSNGEKFRVDLARRLLELSDPIVIDEFTSVVDRQVAKIGAHAAQKYVRRNDRQLVAVTCHEDIEDWLQPDWVYRPATEEFSRRSVQPRPELRVAVAQVGYCMWRRFAPFHYLTASLNKAARCFCLFVEGEPAAFAGVLHRPHPRVKDIKGISRLVTLPDWQGLGLAFVLVDTLGACYRAKRLRLRTYPAHPALIRGFDRSKAWALKTKPTKIAVRNTARKTSSTLSKWKTGRPCAVFEYCGESANAKDARKVLG